MSSPAATCEPLIAESRLFSPKLNYDGKLRMIEWAKLCKKKVLFASFSRAIVPQSHFLKAFPDFDVIFIPDYFLGKEKR